MQRPCFCSGVREPTTPSEEATHLPPPPLYPTPPSDKLHILSLPATHTELSASFFSIPQTLFLYAELNASFTYSPPHCLQRQKLHCKTGSKQRIISTPWLLDFYLKMEKVALVFYRDSLQSSSISL